MEQLARDFGDLPRAPQVRPPTRIGAAARRSKRFFRSGTFIVGMFARLRSLQRSPGSKLEPNIARAAAQTCDIYGVQVVPRGEAPEGPCVYVANHVSYLDPLVLLKIAPAIAVAKIEVESWPIIGRIARSLGMLFVRRGDPYSGARVLLRAIRHLEAGRSVLIFPEGTTTDGSYMESFKRGAFGLARLAGVPVVPVSIRYARRDAAWVGDDPFLPHLLHLAAQKKTTVSAEYYEAIDPQDAPLPDTIALARSEISRGIGPQLH